MAWMNQFSKTNGTADVTVLSAPAASTSRRIPAGGLNIYNNDTTDMTLTVQINQNDTADRLLDKPVLNSGDAWSNSKFVVCLDGADQSLEVFCADTSSVDKGHITVMYRDESQ